MKVLHAPVNVGNQPWTLSRAERALGIDSDLVVNYTTWLNYPADRQLGTLGNGSVPALARRFAAGVAAPFRYDVLHYYFGRSLLYWDDLPRWNRVPFLDLRIGKFLGKPIIMTLQGCDVRLAGESNRRNEATPCRDGGCEAYSTCRGSLDLRRQHLIDNVLPLCSRVFYLNPELGHYVSTGSFLPYANVDIRRFDVAQERRPGPLRILHAPSDPSVKGTALIDAALAALADNYDFEFIKVQGVPHETAIQLYKEADLLIDQIWAGWYGGLAVELMAMGKPVACYIRDADLPFVPEEMRKELPIYRIAPNSLAQDLERVIRRAEEWRDQGQVSRRFVERWHNPEVIARAMAIVYRDPTAPFVLDTN